MGRATDRARQKLVAAKPTRNERFIFLYMVAAWMLPTAPPPRSVLIVADRLNSIGNYLVGRCLRRLCRYEAESIQTDTVIFIANSCRSATPFAVGRQAGSGRSATSSHWRSSVSTLRGEGSGPRQFVGDGLLQLLVVHDNRRTSVGVIVSLVSGVSEPL